MIKLLKWIVSLAAALALAVALLFVLFFNQIVKTGLEYTVPRVTLTDIYIGSSDSSLLSGMIQLNDLVIGNLQGYQDPLAFKIRDVRISFDLSTLIFGKTVIREIIIDAPEIFYEKDGKSNNINQIFDNIRSFIRGTRQLTPLPEKKGEKKLLINSFLVKNGVVNTRIPLISDKVIVSSLSEISLTDAGNQEKTVYEVTDEILKVLSDSVSSAIYNPVREIGKEAQELINKIKGLFHND